jgi:hypothetical protein
MSKVPVPLSAPSSEATQEAVHIATDKLGHTVCLE